MTVTPDTFQLRRDAEIVFVTLLLHQRIRSVGRQHPATRYVDNIFVFEPQEAEVIDALRKIRLDNDVSRNNAARNKRIV